MDAIKTHEGCNQAEDRSSEICMIPGCIKKANAKAVWSEVRQNFVNVCDDHEKDVLAELFSK